MVTFKEDQGALREELSQNILNVPENWKTQYKYFWVAVFKSGTKFAQFDENGNENLFKTVLENMTEVKQLWWVPFENSISYGCEYGSGDVPTITRRGYKKGAGSRWLGGYYYVMGESNAHQYLFLSEKGTTTINNDFNYNFLTQIKDEVSEQLES